ncbi:hypothetical protein B9Z55_021600 [Caenorhabditis nigoni]|uniref:F-box domain-containing protein n=1 Tax=Caenorhabditis nigoni TaxID=1611254 RepID=A0A2G5TSS0_9PELO|nr:hypothetical protein B9Z55_021600 [Caenorhabditis nigoni]
MPIPFLSLPDKDLQYALKCMDIGELVCLSLCSKRTKNLVKSSDLKIESSAKLHKNFIHLDAYPRKLHELQNHPRTISFYHYTDYWIIEKYGTNTYRYTVRREPGSTLSDWIAHFQYIFNAPIIDLFIIGNASLSNLETVKLFIPRCKKLELSDQCSDEVAKMAFRKSFLIAERVKIFKNIFDEDNGIIKYLSLNLKDLMPIRLLSLPEKDLQYTLNCMDIGDLIAFSLCSKRTKNLAKFSNRRIGPIVADVYQNYICLEIRPTEVRRVQDDPDPLFMYLDFSNPQIKLDRKKGIEAWRKEGFAHHDWIAHFLSIFKGSLIDQLGINDVCSISHLDIVKRIIPKFRKLKIMELCSTELTKMTFLKLAPIAEEVEIANKPFGNDISQLLSYNLKALTFSDWRTPLELNNVIITEKELNRFLKLWMKSNHRFYRPKYIKLYLPLIDDINQEELFKGIKYRDMDYQYRLTRADGKELLITISWSSVDFMVL